MEYEEQGPQPAPTHFVVHETVSMAQACSFDNARIVERIETGESNTTIKRETADCGAKICDPQ
jgi:hypothetical protein